MKTQEENFHASAPRSARKVIFYEEYKERNLNNRRENHNRGRPSSLTSKQAKTQERTVKPFEGSPKMPSFSGKRLRIRMGSRLVQNQIDPEGKILPPTKKRETKWDRYRTRSGGTRRESIREPEGRDGGLALCSSR